MKNIILTLALLSVVHLNAQGQKISTFEFTEILNDNRDEALFYFQNNWMQLREKAQENGFIDSFQLHEAAYSDDSPFHLILVTTYSDKAQFDKREENFERIMVGRELKLLNDKKPGDFRKSVFVKEEVRQIE